jgi:hypothetical protein
LANLDGNARESARDPLGALRLLRINFGRSLRKVVADIKKRGGEWDTRG